MTAPIRLARPDDYAAVCELLGAARLPLDGLPRTLEHFIVAEDGGAVVAAAGLEVYEPAALLRSVVVAPTHRGTGLGRRLTDETLTLARRLGVRDVYLLTDTAEAFFGHRGFRVVGRDTVPQTVKTSIEFTKACPESAAVMYRDASVA